MSKRYVLLDRDGTIIVEKNYLADPDLVELLPGAALGLRRLARLGLGMVVVTNQSGLGRGYFNWAALEAVHQRMIDLLAAEDVVLDRIYVCPHAPAESCRCRKPLTGLARRAEQDLGFSSTQGYMVGDKPCDVDLGRNLGACAILVRTGYGRTHEQAGSARPDFVVDDLVAAAELIAGRTGLDGAAPPGSVGPLESHHPSSL